MVARGVPRRGKGIGRLTTAQQIHVDHMTIDSQRVIAGPPMFRFRCRWCGIAKRWGDLVEASADHEDHLRESGLTT